MMATMTIHFISKDTLKLEGAEFTKERNNLVDITDKFGDRYTINMDKVLYILAEVESEEE
jgi:hypothetical protein